MSNVTTRINAFFSLDTFVWVAHFKVKATHDCIEDEQSIAKKSAWLFSFLSSQVHTLWQHHDIKLINEDSGYSRDCIYTCINIITLHLPKLFTNTTTHCGVSKECTKLYGHLNKNYVNLQGGEFRRRIQRGKWHWNSMPILCLCKFQCAKIVFNWNDVSLNMLSP